MGHEIVYLSFPASLTEKQVQAELNAYAYEHETPRNAEFNIAGIRKLSGVCEDYDAAEAFIRAHDRGWYDQLAVQYKHCSEQDKLLAKSVQEAKAKLAAAHKRLKELEAYHFAGQKAAYIGCKACGSKLSAEHLAKKQRHSCPVCGADLRPASKLEQIAKAKEAVVKAKQNHDAVVKKAVTGLKYELFWLIKLEWHV